VCVAYFYELRVKKKVEEDEVQKPLPLSLMVVYIVMSGQLAWSKREKRLAYVFFVLIDHHITRR
jgi:hypothetical protein